MESRKGIENETQYAGNSAVSVRGRTNIAPMTAGGIAKSGAVCYNKYIICIAPRSLRACGRSGVLRRSGRRPAGRVRRNPEQHKQKRSSIL